MLVRGHRQRADRPAVERLLERDDLGARLAARVPVAARELQARLDRFGAAVAEERARQPRQARQPLGELALQRVKEQVRRVQQRLRLLGDRARQARMRVAERGHADARQQIEVLAALGVEQTHALAAHERDRLPPVGLQHVPRFPRLNVVDRRDLHVVFVAATVPLLRQSTTLRRTLADSLAPAYVFSRVTRVEPAASTAAASSAAAVAAVDDHHVATPAASACSQARSLAIMPAVAVPPADAARSSRRGSSSGSVAPSRSSTPAVVPAMTSRRRRAAPPGGPANVSAFTLNSRPSRAMPMHATTGTKPSPSSVVSSAMFGARLGMPTRPRSTELPSTARCGGAGSDSPQPPSAPVSPTARTPAAVSAGDEPRVDGAGQHRDDDVERRLVGDAQPVDLPLLDAGRLQRRVDFLAAAVDDDQPSTGDLSRATRARARDDGAETVPILEQFAAELQDDRRRHSRPVGLVERRA